MLEGISIDESTLESKSVAELEIQKATLANMVDFMKDFASAKDKDAYLDEKFSKIEQGSEHTQAIVDNNIDTISQTDEIILEHKENIAKFESNYQKTLFRKTSEDNSPLSLNINSGESKDLKTSPKDKAKAIAEIRELNAALKSLQSQKIEGKYQERVQTGLNTIKAVNEINVQALTTGSQLAPLMEEEQTLSNVVSLYKWREKVLKQIETPKNIKPVYIINELVSLHQEYENLIALNAPSPEGDAKRDINPSTRMIFSQLEDLIKNRYSAILSDPQIPLKEKIEITKKIVENDLTNVNENTQLKHVTLRDFMDDQLSKLETLNVAKNEEWVRKAAPLLENANINPQHPDDVILRTINLFLDVEMEYRDIPSPNATSNDMQTQMATLISAELVNNKERLMQVISKMKPNDQMNFISKIQIVVGSEAVKPFLEKLKVSNDFARKPKEYNPGFLQKLIDKKRKSNAEEDHPGEKNNHKKKRF